MAVPGPLCAAVALLVALAVAPCRVHADETPTDKRWNKIWAYYRYPRGPTPFVELNLRTWAKHNPDSQIILVNESNIKEWVPDMPDEFFKLPYDQAKSDVIRAATIYHHGGLYMDTDFLCMQSFGKLLSELETHDIISYSDGGKTEEVRCGKQFSSNWHAGRKGNKFSEVWWTNTKKVLTRKCPPGQFVSSVERVCCHEVDAPQKESTVCHIPWAQLEHLKTPAQWTKKHPIDHDIIEQLPKDVKLYCLHGRRALTPHRNGEIFWIPWDSKAMKTLDLPRAQWEIPNYVCKCHMDEASGDLVCGETATKRMLIPPRTYEKFLTRPAYHLFSSTHSAVGSWTVDKVLRNNWMLSHMYRKSLEISLESLK